jgi:hypothetical protein
MMQCRLHGTMLASGKCRIGSVMIPFVSFALDFCCLAWVTIIALCSSVCIGQSALSKLPSSLNHRCVRRASRLPVRACVVCARACACDVRACVVCARACGVHIPALNRTIWASPP